MQVAKIHLGSHHMYLSLFGLFKKKRHTQLASQKIIFFLNYLFIFGHALFGKRYFWTNQAQNSTLGTNDPQSILGTFD